MGGKQPVTTSNITISNITYQQPATSVMEVTIVVTTAQQPAANGAHKPPPETAAPQMSTLWPQPIPIIGVTGEYASGKTLFALSIDPKSTLMFDTEKSSESYSGLGFARVDVPAKMLELYPKGYKPIHTFQWWRDAIRNIKPGQYRVIGLDVASEIETGATDWVRENPAYFSRTAAQYTRMSGLLWGDMKELWKSILADLASRCETFVFAVHTGEVWAGDKPTGKKKPKGKSTLMELASLFLWMERKPDTKGKVPVLPSATVVKSRLAYTGFNAETGEVEIVPSLPPRLPVATPKAIREYMLAPPDYSKLRKEELAPEHVITDDERAEIRRQTAEAEAETERLKLERMSRLEAAERRRTELTTSLPVTTSTPPQQAESTPAQPVASEQQPPSKTAQPAATTPSKPAPEDVPPPIEEQEKATRESRLRFLAHWRSELFNLMGVTDDTKKKEVWASILAKRNVASALELSDGQIDKLTDNIRARCLELNGSTPQPDPAKYQSIQESPERVPFPPPAAV